MPDETISQGRRSRRQRGAEQTIVILFSLVVTLAFCNKAFHIDDPLYLSIARQILIDPLRPFDGLINWQQVSEPAWKVSISPPGYSYWLAAWLAAGVTSEWALHCAGSIWVVALGLATHAWARRLGDWALAATLLVISSPLIIAGQNLMLDVPMLALAASAIAVYLSASDKDSIGMSLLAGLLAGLSVNVKYAGIVVIGVMAMDTVLWRRWRLLGAALAGVSLLILGQFTVASKDGVPQLLYAREWITRLWPSDARDMLHRTSESLMYLGAGVAWIVLLARAMLLRGVWGLGVFFAACGIAVLAIFDLRSREPGVSAAPIAHAMLFACNGSVLLIWLASQLATRGRQPPGPRSTLASTTLAGREGQPPGVDDRGIQREADADRSLAWRTGDRGSQLRQGIMLLAWTVGFWYLGTLNGPFVAPRALVPCILSLTLAVLSIAPAADELGKVFIRGAVLLTLAFGLIVGVSDYLWAGTYREAAPRLMENYRPSSRGTVYFLGHWGWQYYAEAAGMVQYDLLRSRLIAGDIIVWPQGVDYPLPAPIKSSILRVCPEVAREQVAANRWLPRTRSQQGCIFLHGDTANGRLPWGWSPANDPQEVFLILRCGE
jgi:hypothetical protein